MMLGTSIVFCGVIWVVFAKAKPIEGGDQEAIDEDMLTWYQNISIGVAITIGILGAVRTCHGKYVFAKFKYFPLDFNAD